MMGARTIMTTSNEEKAAIAREKLGVAHTLDYRDEKWHKRVIELTDGGVNIVVEVAGGETLGRSIKACTYEGRVGVIGILGGLQSTINVVDLLHKQVTVRGIFMESAQELGDFASAVEAGGLRPWIDREFDFDQAPDAYRHIQSQQHMGKIVINVR
jgi:NADPH:quinone reductase-like Zn-dependent oxidoreductase